jgi:hypothetical protein
MIETFNLTNPTGAPIWKYLNSKTRSKVRASALQCFEKVTTSLIAFNPEYKSVFLP